ncbi:MAG: ribosome biogenesis GTPase Der [Chloroflexi bacterium]|nr:ribosome biogenesis GTPase Der [Chloroflexota bacterium]MBM3176204.1 ribosome biogenesis GTPase Der [Chloroflexota bacterium]MBM4450407.1 ribosome biogenesis GTPase Der [Chloroflexota bacterium]
MKPVVAIVGRANVGKSTLFNRLAGEKLAIVEDLPGTTRDRVFADISWQGREMTLVDTAGLEPRPGSSLAQRVRYQVEAAIAEADVLIFMVDIRDGVIAADQEIADRLRGRGKPVILVANKADNVKLESQASDFYRLGLGSPVTASAHHGRGINELMDKVISLLPLPVPEEAEYEMPKLAIVGRPNVGKSMLLNAIVGEERAVVDEVAGTTRDAVDTVYQHGDQKLLLIDTAGVRRRGRVGVGVEYYSVLRTLRAINRCDIALLVTDATEFIAAQDIHIAGYIKQACKGMVLLVNKWDLVQDNPQSAYAEQIEQRLKFMSHAPVLYVSAKTGQGVNAIIPKAMEVWQERQKQLPDKVIDTLIKEAFLSHTPPRKGFRQLEVVRAYQSGVNPPTFAFLVNDPKLVHFSYQRFLENKLRQTFGFSGTALQLLFRKAKSQKRKKNRSGRA